MLYRVALQGFAESERRSLASFLRDTGGREPGYRLVHLIAQADVILADGDSAHAVGSVVNEGRAATTLFIGEQRPLEAVWHVVRPTSPAELLHGLDDIVARIGAVPEATASRADADAHSRAKAAARQAARRARLATTAASAEALAIPPDVLVLDPNDKARDHLCALLEYFGFCAYPARSTSQALWLLETRPFRAAFLHIALDGSDGGEGIELCQRFKNGSRHVPAPESALFILSGNPQPADQVRATLAGGDALLVEPLGRSDIASALEACGVTMPADPRRR